MHRWHIRTKIVLFSLLPTLGIALLLASVFVFSRLNDLNTQLLKEGSSTARHLANLAEHGVLSNNSNQLIVQAGLIQEESHINTATIYSYKGHILAHSGPQITEQHTIPASFTEKPTTYRSDLVLRFSMPIRLADLSLVEDSSRLTGAEFNSLGKLMGWALVEVNQQAFLQEKMNTVAFALIAIIFSSGLSICLSLYLTRSLSKPLHESSNALEEIRKGKLDTRVNFKAGAEFSTLKESINSLAEALARARSEMQESNDQVTMDLRETLETIEVQNIELDIARKKALEASRVKSEFLANMSHEIRTPLNGIIGFTKLLYKSNLSMQQRDQLNTVLKSSEILLTIINDILDFSKIEAGKLVLDSVHLNLNEIVEDVLIMLAPGAHEKELELAGLVYSDVPSTILGDPLRIKQIITNLVSNGIKFSERGEVVVRVMLEDDNGDGKLLKEDHNTLIKITVTDTGVGLSRVQKQALFNAFSQADVSTARRFGGTGLGLVISRKLTEQMGGSIGAESELGRGSEFWVTLPVDVVSSKVETPDYLPPQTGDRFIYWESQTISQLAISNVLSKWGASYVIVNRIEQLLDQVDQAQQQRKGYSAAIIGITKKQLRSTTLLNAVRRLEYQLDCRTLILTPTIDAGAEEPPVLTEASNYLIKPPSQRRLAMTLSQLIHGSVEDVSDKISTAIPAQITHLRKPKILAVDDNSANLKLIHAFLEDLGVIVETARSGYEALNKVKLRRYDLVFMDVQMPGMDGIETTAKIREYEVGKKSTSIVALTAHALSEEKDILLASGFDGYLTKPTNEVELQSIIANKTGFNLEPTTTHTNIPLAPPKKPMHKEMNGPSVDINAGVQLAGQKPDLAEELFSMLLESLPTESESIISSHKNAEFEKLLETVHRLHGATRYCGVPLLRKAASELETSIKRRDPKFDWALNELLNEIENVLYWSDLNDWQLSFRSYKPSQ